MRQPIKAHLVNRSNRPVNRSNRPVYRYEPVELSFLNSNLNSTDFRPNRTDIPVPDPGGLADRVGKWTLQPSFVLLLHCICILLYARFFV